MNLEIVRDREAMGRWVAAAAAENLRAAIASNGEARLIVATGSSQFEVLEALTREELPWSHVTGFHLDEYVGLSDTHPASFCGYLRDRFVERVPLKAFHYMRGDSDVAQTLEAVGTELTRLPIDVAMVGIGENGHLAFNDPPADFDTQLPYLIVELDEACRMQQVGEGWFASLDDVPKTAMSMSVHQIMQARRIYCSVPDRRKADAVRRTLEGPVTPDCPASILQRHGAATIVVDQDAASQLSEATPVLWKTA